MKLRPPALFHRVPSLSSSSVSSQDSTTRFQTRLNPRKGNPIFAFAALRKLGENPPQRERHEPLLSRLREALNARLQPRGDEKTVRIDERTSARGQETGLSNILKHSDSDTFSVRLRSGQTVERTQEEVETHILLQSHLAANFYRTGVNRREVISLKEIGAPRTSPRFANPLAGIFARTPTTRRSSRCEPVSTNVVRDAQAPLPKTPVQLEALAFVEQHLSASPLDFFDAMAKQHPELAGHFALQLRRMQTPVEPQHEISGFTPSLYPGVKVLGCGSTEMIYGPRIHHEDPVAQSYFERAECADTLPIRVFFEDLETRINDQNRLLASHPEMDGADTSRILPLGLPNTLRTSSPEPHTSDAAPEQANALSALEALHSMPNTSGSEEVQWLQELTANHPAAAGFLGFVREALLLTDCLPEKPCQRFPYVDDTKMPRLKARLRELRGNPENTSTQRSRDLWGPTFLEGIERNPQVFGSGRGCWRVRNGDQWIENNNEQEVIRHVMYQALAHLDASTAPPVGSPLFPLAVYELLGKAIGKPVPQFLQEREARIVAEVTENDAQAKGLLLQQEEAYSQREAEKAQQAENLERRCRQAGARNSMQLVMCQTNFVPARITSGSADKSFPFNPTAHSQLQAVRNFQGLLSQTHSRQAIAHKTLDMVKTDNLCWLRSSWLSVFSAASPRNLAIRLGEMYRENLDPEQCSFPPSALEQIAEAFRADPVRFLHGEAQTQSWQHQLQHVAHLGVGQTIAPGRNISLNSEPKPLEGALHTLHESIVAGFRYENPHILDDLESAAFNQPASSDVVIALHRAFQVPGMVVEVGPPYQNQDGTNNITASHIRIAAQSHTPLASQLEQMEQMQTGLADNVYATRSLLSHFSDKPVIWLERGHFEVYFPKGMLSRRASC